MDCPTRVSFLLRLLLAAALLVPCGCATSSTAIVDEEIVTNQKPMNSYKQLLVRDFELKPELYGTIQGAPPGEQEKRYSAVPGRLSEQIIRYVKASRNYGSVVRSGTPGPATLVLGGQFTRMGRFRISIEATLKDGATGQEVAYFRQTLWDIVDTTDAVGRLAREISDFIDRIQYK